MSRTLGNPYIDPQADECQADAIAATDARLHGDWPAIYVSVGEARVVRCPDCGQMEVWSERELADHGKCRATTGPCAVCGER